MKGIFQQVELELLVIILLTVLFGVTAFVFAPFILWIKTNRYKDILDVIKFHEENKKIYSLNDQSLKDITTMVRDLGEKMIHLENNFKQYKNSSDTTEMYKMFNKICDRLDKMETIK